MSSTQPSRSPPSKSIRAPSAPSCLLLACLTTNVAGAITAYATCHGVSVRCVIILGGGVSLTVHSLTVSTPTCHPVLTDNSQCTISLHHLTQTTRNDIAGTKRNDKRGSLTIKHVSCCAGCMLHVHGLQAHQISPSTTERCSTRAEWLVVARPPRTFGSVHTMCRLQLTK